MKRLAELSRNPLFLITAALVVAAIAIVVACWLWAGRIMAVPEEQRVFDA